MTMACGLGGREVNTTRGSISGITSLRIKAISLILFDILLFIHTFYVPVTLRFFCPAATTLCFPGHSASWYLKCSVSRRGRDRRTTRSLDTRIRDRTTSPSTTWDGHGFGTSGRCGAFLVHWNFLSTWFMRYDLSAFSRFTSYLNVRTLEVSARS